MPQQSRGADRERRISLKYADKTAVLVSPLLMRRLGAGQVDFCYLSNGALQLIEVKSSLAGISAYKAGQRQRLRQSARFLSELTGLSVRISLESCQNDRPFLN